MTIMTFFLGDESYGVDIAAVDSVAPGDAATGAETLDLAEVLGVGGAPAGGRGAVLRLRGPGGGEVAVRVGRMGEVVEVPDRTVQGLPPQFDTRVLGGVVALGEQLVVLLDGDALVREYTRAGVVHGEAEG